MNPDESALRTLIDRWHAATAAGDVEALLPLMAEDVVFLTPGAAPMRGRTAFGEGLRALFARHRVESKGAVQEIQVSGDLAYAWTHLEVRITPTPHGKPRLRAGHALSVFRKEADGRWVLLRDANLMGGGA